MLPGIYAGLFKEQNVLILIWIYIYLFDYPSITGFDILLQSYSVDCIIMGQRMGIGSLSCI